MSKMLCRSLATAVLLAMTAAPSLAQFAVYENLAYVPRQGNLNTVVGRLGPQLEGVERPSINQLAEAYKLGVELICSNNPEGQMVNWFGKVHAIEDRGDTIQVELIVAEKASAIAVLPADSDLAGQLRIAAGRWVRFDGNFISDASCLLQVPPLTLSSLLQPRYLAKITSVSDSVSPSEVEQLEIALPGDAWTGAAVD